MTARVLVIAGSDSGGGAGIQADIRAITALGGHAMTAITAITAQNTRGVTAVEPVSVALIFAQIDAVIEDIGVDAVKIGMIGSAEAADAVADRLARLPGVPIVFDPVMVATSGARLADAETIAAFERLMRLATLVTPNAPELAALTGGPIGTVAAMEAASRALALRVDAAVLAKGGHLAGDRLVDLLVTADDTTRWSDARIVTRHSHGTGCTLASAVATGLAEGQDMAAAIARGRRYVRAALLCAPGLGAGDGPVGMPLHPKWL